ncbi:PH domain-containing protein [Paenibacillus macquariensis]|uniref:PH domain-containing protein n=1 Tax=Paenibacillus macquariensis TaxID=948756 RepID=A0ABY1JJE1_9BACL|nr:PH domain-containing protein [Paenibacillus macquariensis]MEC0089708.1 PH domain-containing protein [Paenibacillus macquariensis]OAB30813.1 hypothetical protein PMSM_22005 [Paenibacillus macquariensis subsp. macquariensis]SIQ29288.1 PH domain-containing protein [Paenibacillus macquariensis]
MKFIPRRDLWLSITMWFCIIGLALASISPLFKVGTNIIGGSILFLFCMGMAGFIAWIWLGVVYKLLDTELFIRMGPLTNSITYDSITHVKPVRSWISNMAMATSSRKVEIKYGRYDVVQVSPLDQETFIRELRIRCPHVHIE